MNIMEIYNGISSLEKENFTNNTMSTVTVKQKKLKSTYDDEWLVKMEEAIKYIDNILRNPNRFIVNEEEIVKIELARRITVDSIKHLSRNTNFIQEYDPKTGEVRPSKILNINKEESFNTYENRFIHTLINNMKMYIERKKTEQISSSLSNNDVEIEYNAANNIKNRKIEYSLKISEKEKGDSKAEDLSERIKAIEDKVKILESSDIYKNLEKLHVAPVTSPIKKTNLILKNVNFQYALDLWNYLQSHMEPSLKKVNDNKTYKDEGNFKNLMDDSFLLNYEIMQTLKDDEDKSPKADVEKRVINNAINQLLALKDELSLDDIIKLTSDEFVKIKYKNVASTKDISNTYKEAINEYTKKVHDLKVVENEKK